MNKQLSKTGRGIEWCDYTLNVMGGCQHGCRWEMPDGSVAICYAELVATRVAQAHYPHGFEHHYWHPERLGEPGKVSEPSRIFIDSMADLFGRWVPAEHIQAVMDMCCQFEQHTFISLTKNAPRLLGARDFPANLWLGVSSPPDQMFGQALSGASQRKMLRRSLDILARFPNRVTWMSFEPLSWDVSDIVAEFPDALDWAVIGAASNGAKTYQPETTHVERLLEVLDSRKIPVFFKGNLKNSPAAQPWREEFPVYA